MKVIKKISKNAYSLVEVLVAVSVIVAIMAVTVRMRHNSNQAEEIARIVAYNHSNITAAATLYHLGLKPNIIPTLIPYDNALKVDSEPYIKIEKNPENVYNGGIPIEFTDIKITSKKNHDVNNKLVDNTKTIRIQAFRDASGEETF